MERPVDQSGRLLQRRLIPVSEASFGLPRFLYRIFFEKEIAWSASPDLIELGCWLWGIAPAQTFILPRCVAEADKIVQRYHADKVDYAGITVISGNKGVGKSCFGLTVLARIARSGRIILVEMMGRQLLFVTREAWMNTTSYVSQSNAGVTNQQTLEQVLAAFGEAMIDGPGIYKFTDANSGMFKDLTEVPQFVRYVDVGDEDDATRGCIIPLGSPSIIVAGLRSPRLSRLREISAFLHITLPRWTFDEIRQLNQELRKREEPAPASSKMALAKSDDCLDELFQLFGGVPREIFKQWHSLRQAMNHANALSEEASTQA